MDEPVVRYIKPDFFDWGVYKPHGWWILLFSALTYVACFVVSVILVQRIGRALGYPTATLMTGMLALVPMLYAGASSVLLQLGSSHYQERTHVPALITVGVSFGMVVAAKGLVALLVRRAQA